MLLARAKKQHSFKRLPCCGIELPGVGAGFGLTLFWSAPGLLLVMFWFCFAHAKAGQKRARSKPEQIQNNSKTTAKQTQNNTAYWQNKLKTTAKQWRGRYR
jgi:hypothetical protein